MKAITRATVTARATTAAMGMAAVTIAAAFRSAGMVMAIITADITLSVTVGLVTMGFEVTGRSDRHPLDSSPSLPVRQTRGVRSGPALASTPVLLFAG